jgi:NTE family protein/lysophospholipid hydrolase
LKSAIGNRKSAIEKPLILALLHPSGTGLPSGAAAWLEALSPAEQFHVREGHEGDFARLARCLTGRAVGLALGGGGARGLAHLGVIRALLDLGVPIDRVAGASMGAIIGAAAAMEMPYAAELALGRKAFIEGRPHKEYTLPLFSLIRSRRLDRLLAGIYGETRIEDLWRPFLAVSCNLTTAELAVHRRGPVWKAVRASLALPGVFTPAVENGELLVDGGVLNNLPGDLLRGAGCARVIVVDVSPPQDLAMGCAEFPSPWRRLWRRLWRRAAPHVPSIVDILTRTVVISSEAKVRQVKRDADLCLAPPVTHYGMLQFEAMAEIADAGYAYTRELLRRPDRPPWLNEFLPPEAPSAG